MPRISAEARAAAVWREGGPSPPPPQYLSAQSKKVWREIVERWPSGHFKPGALHLLEQFCVAVVAARKVGVELEKDPANPEVATAYLGWATRCATHCQKLGLTTIATIDRKSGRLNEWEPVIHGGDGVRF